MHVKQQSRRSRSTAFLALAAVVALAWLLSTPAPSSATAAPSVQARSGILIRSDTGVVLWSNHPGLRLPMASCTKIMTALLVLEHYGDLSRYVRVPASATARQTVAVGLHRGDRITVRQALRAMLIKSANDATIALAVAVAGSEKAFVTRMNRRARQLGLTRTHYVNARGTDASRHYSSARDLATLGRYAMKHEPVFRAIVGTKTATIKWPPSHHVTVTSHNRLLDYDWGNGIKTGATDKAGMVLVGSGTPSGVPLIVVTMHEPTRNQEERDAVALFEWGALQ